MNDFFIKIYDYLQARRATRRALLWACIGLLAAGACTLHYKEDIADFLPFDTQHRRAMSIYQNISATDRMVILMELRDTTLVDPDRLTAAVDSFGVRLAEIDTAHVVQDFALRIDYEQMQELSDYLYRHIALFLTDADYRRIDSLMTPEAMRDRLTADKALLFDPAADGQIERMRCDPLGLFTPVIGRLRGFQGYVAHSIYDGYIFTPDRRKVIAMLTSPYGASETRNNTVLVQMLDRAATEVESGMPDVDIHMIGGPAIAVTNASQIKTDSILALSIAAVLILTLLLYAFRSLRSLLKIAGSIGFGWLFALGGMACVNDRLSIIVLGIASVIIGIAVNYPLHFVAHLNHRPDCRGALRDMVAPLLIGNITTVGAFLCLVPLDAPALRDLGLFSSLMLIGTIVFVLIFLPHWMRRGGMQPTIQGNDTERLTFGRLSRFSFGHRPWLILLVAAITGVLAYFSLSTDFDSDMHHINYMTEQQEHDLLAFQELQGQRGTVTIYATASADNFDDARTKAAAARPLIERLRSGGAIVSAHHPVDFLPTVAEQNLRLQRWNDFVASRADTLLTRLQNEAGLCGFRADAFTPWTTLLRTPQTTLSWEELTPLAQGALANYLTTDSTGCHVVMQMEAVPDRVADVESAWRKYDPDGLCFDIPNLNSTVANALSGEFNYIGWACSLIVFLFLWLSFGRLELSLLAFLPMAVSWIWILGIMELCDIRFNIVNVILATFIFGQGDDYTIFMTEGLMYEYAYRRKLLASYKNSIILSALIMFIGIGSLIVARHPALHSLAEVTIVGMFSVVLMAYLLPPIVFHALVQQNGAPRLIPLTFGRIGLTLSVRWQSLLLRLHLWPSAWIRLPGLRIVDTEAALALTDGVALLPLPGRMMKIGDFNVPARDLNSTLRHELLRLIAARYGGRIVATAAEVKSGETLFGLHGCDLVAHAQEAWLCPGRLTLVPIPKEVCETSALARWQKDLCLRLETTEYFRRWVKAQYLYKGADLERHARRILAHGVELAEWIDTYDDPHPVALTDCGNGEIALLFAYVHPEIPVWVITDREDTVALICACAARPQNLSATLCEEASARLPIDATIISVAKMSSKYLANKSERTSRRQKEGSHF